MAKRPGLPKETPDPTPENAGSPSGEAPPQPEKRKRGPNKPKTPASRIGFLLSEEDTAKVRAAARAYTTTEEQVLERLRGKYAKNAFRPHLEAIVSDFESEAEAEKQARRAEIFGDSDRDLSDLHAGAMAGDYDSLTRLSRSGDLAATGEEAGE